MKDLLTVTIHRPGTKPELIACKKNETLLRVLQQHEMDVYAPCGGKGTCGKCLVEIIGEGIVTACIYTISHSIEIKLPEERQQKILTSQHAFCLEFDKEFAKDSKLTGNSIGLAIDIGTTTLVFYFIDLNNGSILETTSGLNPQSRYGADVISRITFCNREKEKIREMQRCIIDEINNQINIFCRHFERDFKEIMNITVAGNPTMLHFLLGIDPMPIALAPFTPVFIEEQLIKASKFDLKSNSVGILRTLPSISAYVGSDIVAGIASIKPSKTFTNYLFLDIGTNGEMALVTPDKIYCCATAAGPAFEGGNISCGMGAFNGAISEFTDSSNYKTINDKTPKGICGSGLIDIISHMVDQKVVSSEGSLDRDFILHTNENSGAKIAVSQQDIREVQLAKSAIIAGVNILMQTSKLEFSQLDALFLAGGFGNYIKTESAINIGLLPAAMKGKTISLGNTSGTGACLSLQSKVFEKNLVNVINKSDYIELSTHEDFVMEYAMNMNF